MREDAGLKEKEEMVEILTFDEFSIKMGCPAHFPARAELHRYPRRPPESQLRATKISELKRSAAWAARREELKTEYDSLVEMGKVRPPTRIEILEKAASGHPDNESTKAARRLLDKMNAK